MKPSESPSQSLLQTTNGSSSSTWSCRRCTFANISDLNSCEVCEAPRSPNIPLTLPRKPIVVTYSTVKKDKPNRFFLKQIFSINRIIIFSHICRVKESSTGNKDQNGHVPDGTMVVNELYESSWSCKKCTLINALSKQVCSACGCSQLYSQDTSVTLPRKKDTWSCIQCTLLNPNSLQKCRACKTPQKKQEEVIEI